jgi:hypothetical protein
LPAGTEPVNPAAVIRGSFSAVIPTSKPAIRPNEPSGAPAARNASIITSAVRADSSG